MVSTTLDDLKPGRNYAIKVAAYNDVGSGPVSKSITVETPEEKGIISFANSIVETTQSSKKVVLKVLRKECTRGRVVVPWSTQSEMPYFNDLKGLETFTNGEEDSTIEIEMPKLPHENDIVEFTVKLGEPTGISVLSDDVVCKVNVTLDVLFGLFGFENEEIKTKQSEESLKIPVKRVGSSEGKVVA